MPLDKGILLNFLEEVEKEIVRKITVVAVGGTAMTLLDLKPSTIDMDFTIPHKDAAEFRDALGKIPHGFKIDCWEDGMVFSQTLPDDYLEKSIPIKTKLKKIVLKALHPIDIVVTKIGRMDDRDLQDIEACIRKFNLTKEQIENRAKSVQYVGREENYQNNLNFIIKRLFD